MLVDMVLADKSAPTSVLEYSCMGASDLFTIGKAVMVMTHTVDANRFKDPKKALAIQNDWAVAPSPKWDKTKPADYPQARCGNSYLPSCLFSQKPNSLAF